MLIGKYINKYYLKYSLFFIIGILALVLVDYFQLYIPQYLGRIVDLFSLNDSVDVSSVSEIIKDVVIIAIIMFLGRVIWRLSIFNASQRIEAKLRHKMFLKSERLSLKYYHENKIGSIMSWFTSDLETIEEFLGWGTIMLVDAFFLSALVIYKMIKLDIVLSVVTFIPLILIVIWGALVEKFMAMNWKNRQDEFDKLYEFSQESFTGIRVIKAFVKENQRAHAFALVAKRNKDANIKFAKISVLFDCLITLITTVVMAMLLLIGGWFVYKAFSGTPVVIFKHSVDITSGQLISFIGYFEIMVWPMMALGQIVSMRSRAKASLKRITSFLDSEEDIVNPKDGVIRDNISGKIEFKNFTFSYPGSSNGALSGINLTINSGETVGIVGKVGSGKSTLVNSLLRLYNVDSNTIFIDDVDIMKLDIPSLRNSISYVPQDNFLFSDKIINNISFADHKVNYEAIYKAARFASVDKNIEGFKEGYDTVSGERGVSLSGGQKQRISIARAYYKNSPIMILDDSVSAVDVKTEGEILSNIREYRKDKTTIVIASRVSTVKNMDKIIVLDDGRLEGFGTHDELLKNSALYQKMVYLQSLETEVLGGNSNE